jgi:DNA-binding NtrC family response regulator
VERKRILIVDDHHDICDSMRDILEAEGFLVDVAHCGDEAIELAQRCKPDVVVLDYQMPGINGVELFVKINQIQPQVVSFLITAYAGISGVQDAMKHGINFMLQKPIDVTQFLTKLREAATP